MSIPYCFIWVWMNLGLALQRNASNSNGTLCRSASTSTAPTHQKAQAAITTVENRDCKLSSRDALTITSSFPFQPAHYSCWLCRLAWLAKIGRKSGVREKNTDLTRIEMEDAPIEAFANQVGGHTFALQNQGMLHQGHCILKQLQDCGRG